MPVDALSTLARIQRIQYSTLVWMFADAVRNYNEMLLNHQARCKAIIRQQLQISKCKQNQLRIHESYCNENHTINPLPTSDPKGKTDLWCCGDIHDRRMRKLHNEELHNLYTSPNVTVLQLM
jgi:hypothetical protein